MADRTGDGGTVQAVSEGPVWWWNATSSSGSEVTVPASLWADVWKTLSIEDVLRVKGAISSNMRPFDEGFAPDCLYLDDIRPKPRVDLFDLAPIKQGAFIVSGAMMDFLSGFDLGETQLIDLPFYNQKDARAPGAPFPEPVPDRARPIPGRWGLLHLLARKAAFVPEHSAEFRTRGTHADGNKLWGLNTHDNIRVAVDAERARAGVDLWMDPYLNNFIFMSDRLRSGILEHPDLSAPMVDDFRRAKLVGKER